MDGKVIGQIGKGFMVLIGVADSDTKEIADKIGQENDRIYVFLRMKKERRIFRWMQWEGNFF